MATWNVKVVVEYEYEVEADSYEEAEKQGWEYEEYYYCGTVDSIECEEQEEDDEEENLEIVLHDAELEDGDE